MTTQKTWDEEWSETKDSLKHFIQGKINELGIDNDLCVPDYILAEAMIQTLHSTRILHNLSLQTVTGRGGLDGNVENKCPICGADEKPISGPRTLYECGSSDYDQRPETFQRSAGCWSDNRKGGLK